MEGMSARNTGILVLFLSIHGSCAESPPDRNKLTLAVAASHQFAAVALKKDFEAQTDARVDIIPGSSGQLTAQIRNGAPYDVFLPADAVYAEYLQKRGLLSGPLQEFARGYLVLWSLKQISLEDVPALIQNPSIRRIGVANPETAPYGRAAVEYLKHLGLFDSVKHKIIYGESVSQINRYVATSAVDLGFTAKSIVFSPSMKNKGTWKALDTGTYGALVQVAVMPAGSGDRRPRPISLKFMAYLKNPTALGILNDYGYGIPENKSKGSSHNE